MAMDASKLSKEHRPSATDRRDLYRAFLAWTGDPTIADDLAQEALLAAWASNRQPENPAEWRPWLFGVARNILLRWRRDTAKHGQRTAPPPECERHLLAASAPDDLDDLLTRDDIVDLLDAALERLPAETRQALLLRYIDDLPQAAVADLLGVHEKALEGRLHRGKRAMHRFLITEKPESAISLGLVQEPGVWVTTDIWCTSCGMQRLVGRWWENGSLRLDCPSCVDWAPRDQAHFFNQGRIEQERHATRSFRKSIELVSSRFTPLEYLGRDMILPCPKCGNSVRPVEHEIPTDINLPPGPTLRYECATCGHVDGFSWLPGTGSTRNDVRSWRAQHARTRMLRPKIIRFQQRDAVASTWVALDSQHSLTVIHDLETWRVLHVDFGPGDR